MKPSRRALALVLATTFAAACAGTGKPRPAQIKEETFKPDASGNVVYLTTAPSASRTVLTKNYTVGQRRVSTVGEPMVGVRNYTAADRVAGAVVLQPFVQLCRAPAPGETEVAQYACRSGRLAMLRGELRDRFEVPGGFTEAGKAYYFVKIPAQGGSLYLAVDTEGRVKSGRYAAWAPDDVHETPAGVPLRWQDTPTPLFAEGPLFRFETDESVMPDSANFVHYEIIYKGTTYDYRGMVYHLFYREYRRDNPSLPLYQQDLEFSGSVTTVDVLGLRIRVHDVNDSQIVYTVLSD